MAKKGSADYMTVTEAAKRWNVSSATVIRMIHEAELTGLKIRGHYRIARSSVEAHEKARQAAMKKSGKRKKGWSK